MNSQGASTVQWVKAVLVALLVAGIYHSAFTWLAVKDWGREDYNYGYIIPLVALYLLYEKRKEVSAVPAAPSWLGLAVMAGGLVLFWLGELSGEFFGIYVSSWLVLVGLCWSWLGWRKLKTIGFPLVVLLFMFPLPHFINDAITLRLKLVSSKLGVWMLQAYGMTAYREGNIIDLGFTQLQVVDACSGLRYLYPLVIMAILLAYFFKSAWWKKIVLVVSAVPLTIFINSLRIAMTGVLYEVWGAEVAEDFFHGFSGWLIFIFGLAVLLLVMWVLKKIPPEAKFSPVHGSRFTVHGVTGLNAEGSKPTAGFHWLDSFNWFNSFRTQKSTDPTESTNQTNPTNLTNPTVPISSNQTLSDQPIEPNKPVEPIKHGARSGLRALLHPPQFIVAVLLLTATLAAAQGIEFREKIPPAKSFAEFPTTIGEWAGKRDVLEQKFIDTLDLSDYVIIDYRDAARKEVNFYTAYYQSQRKGESIHSPETCLPGSGWEFKRAGSVTVPLGATPDSTGSTGRRVDGSTPSITVNRAVLEKGPHKQLSYFWFPQRDRVLTNAWELKIYNFWDALTRQRTDGALVRLVTPLYADESIEDADRRLEAFTGAIVPVLKEFLPK